MGTVRFNRQREAWMVDYVAATGQRIRQIIGPGEEGRRLARQVLKQREAEAACVASHAAFEDQTC